MVSIPLLCDAYAGFTLGFALGSGDKGGEALKHAVKVDFRLLSGEPSLLRHEDYFVAVHFKISFSNTSTMLCN